MSAIAATVVDARAMSTTNNNNANNNDLTNAPLLNGTADVSLPHTPRALSPASEGPSLYDPMAALRELEASSDGGKKIAHRRRKPVLLEFKDLQLAVGEKQIIKGVSGHAAPGHVVALMGPSGAGKTSLLDLLAGRITVSKSQRTIAGAVHINGEKRDFDEFRTLSAYVLQSDNMFAELTVRETITLSALLRLPTDMPEENKLRRVEQLITELGLTKCANTIVGSAIIRGVSGGERKRVNVATELVTDPALVFLDEPTSGLDSFNAQSVMQMLLRLARNGRTVVTTIHQPRSSIYEMFDTLMLLSEGRMMYVGPADAAMQYFATRGFPCPSNFNPADYFMDLLAIDHRTPKLLAKSRGRVNALGRMFLEYREANKDQPLLSSPSSHRNSMHGIDKTGDSAPSVSDYDEDVEKARGMFTSKNYASSWFYQFGQLSWRSWTNTLREKANNIALLGQTIIFSLLVGFVWLKAGGADSGKPLQSIAGFLYFIVINQAFSGMFGVLFLFPTERAVVLKERGSRMYQVGAYFWSKTLTELPRNLMVNFIFAVISYFMVDLRTGGDYFFIYYCVLVLMVLSSEGLAYIVGALVSDTQQGGAIAPVFM